MSKIYKRSLLLLQVLAILIIPLVSKSQECEKMKITDFPKKDLPSDFQPEHVKQEDVKEETSSKYYYGIGVPIDYVKARRLAFIEMAILGDQDDPFKGASILMMLYANGFGVERNLDISIRLACANVGWANAEIEGRVQHLKEIKSGESKGVFDICDDITSGYMDGYCQSIHSELADIARKATMDSVIRSWPKKDQLAYDRLKGFASDFFYQRTTSEVDELGTSRAAFVLQESGSLEDGFTEEILDADKCNFVSYTAQDFIAADKELNSIYSKIMNDKTTKWGIETTVTKEGIRSTQRKWILYRDAWVDFGAVRCPGVTDISWKTLITKERVSQLQSFVEE
ncbi:MAG TPA: lysozyme inhibitor LprI family protein [Puia sp.]|nr:lysozyme inhibitor LprI family protein [Puia sp.]